MLLVLIRYDLDTLAGARPQFEQIGLTADDVCDLSSYFRRIGFWRMDIEQGLTYWTRGVFDIFGMEFRDGPVSLTEANAVIHPNDLGPMLEIVEQAAATACRFTRSFGCALARANSASFARSANIARATTANQNSWA